VKEGWHHFWILFLLLTPPICRDENGTNIFRPYSRLNSFREVQICPYSSPNIHIWYCIHIWILKSYIYDVNIQSYLIQHGWHYPYLNLNLTKNMKTNMISVISIRIWSVFIPMAYGLKPPTNCYYDMPTIPHSMQLSQTNHHPKINLFKSFFKTLTKYTRLYVHNKYMVD